MAGKAEGVTIAFLGTGAMDVDSATDLIEEYIDSAISSDDDPVRFVFPLTADEFSDTLGELVDMARQSDITYEVITSTSDKSRRAFTDIAGAAARTYHVADPYTQMEQILTEAPTAILEVLWDKEREEELSEILGKFVDAGVDVRDLTDGNAPIAANDEEEAGEAGAEASDESDDGETSEGEIVYARSDLEKLSRADIKEIAVGLGLPPRKSSAAMIEEILEHQGGYEGEPAAAEPEAPVVVTEETEAGTTVTLDVELVKALVELPLRLNEVVAVLMTDTRKLVEEILTSIEKN